MNTTITAPSNVMLRLVQVLVPVFFIAFLVGAYRAYTYDWALANGQPHQASRSMMADRPAALYDHALELYKLERYNESAEALKLALEQIHDSQGNVKADKRELAAEIKYLSGLVAERSKQIDTAKEYYREALRLKPGHLYAIWNLERLENPPLPQDGGGSGKGDGKGDPNQPQPDDKQNPDDKPQPPGTKPGGPKKGI